VFISNIPWTVGIPKYTMK